MLFVAKIVFLDMLIEIEPVLKLCCESAWVRDSEFVLSSTFPLHLEVLIARPILFTNKFFKKVRFYVIHVLQLLA